MNYYERHLGDYVKDTAHLTMLEQGAYNLLLDRYYGTETGIPADQVYRVTRASTKQEKAAVNSVLKEFFKLKAGTWIKDRCDQEIARYLEKRQKASDSAHQRWENERNAKAMRTHNEGNALQSPVSSLQTKEKNSEAKSGLSRNRKEEFGRKLSEAAQGMKIKEST